jgi:hypothetical protein
MKLSADHIFHIGSQHLRSGMPCQDYAVSGPIGDGAYAVVSDGCSSGGKTEVGSKIVALAAGEVLREDFGANLCTLSARTWEKMRAVSRPLGLTQNDMLATLVVAQFQRGEARVLFVGDGVAAFVYMDGSMTLFRLEWANNTPQYLAYESDGFRQFIHAHGGRFEAPATTMTRVECAAGGIDRNVSERVYSLNASLKGHAAWPIHHKQLAYVAAFSDGVTQIKGADWVTAARELLFFKSTAGAFAKRRMNAFLRDEARAGNIPLDDIAYAVIHIEPDEGAP